MDERQVQFLGDSREVLRGFPADAKRKIGFELQLLAEGEEASVFKPMTSVGQGVYEVRERADRRTFRVFYVAKFEEAVYVLHAFEKKTQKTSKSDIEVGKARYKELMALRKGLTARQTALKRK